MKSVLTYDSTYYNDWNKIPSDCPNLLTDKCFESSFPLEVLLIPNKQR